MSNINNSTVSQVELPRYMGKWYEIARFNHRFEKGLQGVTAEYSFREDGKIRVQNCGHKNTLSGKKICSIGKARLPKDKQPGKLRVSFFLSFYSDYDILELDTNYKWALIGSKSDKYLWILSRTPQLPPDTLNNILEKAQKRGYDTSKFIFVQQSEDQI